MSSGPGDLGDARLRRGPLALVVLLALWAHGPGLAGGFVYDDHRFVVQNGALADLSVTDALLDPATHTADRDRDVYRPVRALAHAYDRARWGVEPFGYHLHSLLLHLVTVVLAARVLARLLPQPGPAPPLCAALLLAVHPLGVEVVDWISSRGDQYALLGALVALGLGCTGTGRAAALGAGLAAAVATLGKESAAVLPAVAWVHARALAPTAAPRARGLPRGVLPLALGVGLALVLRQVALSGVTPVQTPPHGGSQLSQVGWAAQGLWRLMALVIWPSGLSVDHPQDVWAAAGSVWGQPRTWLGLGLLATVAWAALRGRGAWAWLVAWAGLAWLPSGSLLVTLRSLLTERAALPMLPALGALLGLLLARRSPRVVAVVLGVLGLALAQGARGRVAAFHDDHALWSTALEVHPGSVQARLALAASEPDATRAGRLLREAVDVAAIGSKLQAVALSRLGEHRLLREGRVDEAVAVLDHALAAWERWATLERPGTELVQARSTLALGLVMQRRYADAEALLSTAIAGDQDPAALLVRRALMAGLRFSQEGDGNSLAAARAALAEARAVAPGHPLLEALAARIGP